jgi:hypothetical protein
MSHHIVLIGDSIFDNRAYTGGEPDVVEHLRRIIPSPWRATLCAVDGSMIADLKAQLPTVPQDASNIVISIGGNDILMNTDILAQPVASTTDALELFNNRVTRFERDYRAAIEGVLELGCHTTICAIYNGNLEPDQALLARIALMMFNDVILRVAFEQELSIIDLRLICNQKADYANPIEPSGRGGRKIATAIARSVGPHNDHVKQSSVFTG